MVFDIKSCMNVISALLLVPASASKYALNSVEGVVLLAESELWALGR